MRAYILSWFAAGDASFEILLAVIVVLLSICVLIGLMIHRSITGTPKTPLSDRQKSQLKKYGVLHFTEPDTLPLIMESMYLKPGKAINPLEKGIVWLCPCSEDVIKSIQTAWPRVRSTRKTSIMCIHIFYCDDIEMTRFKIQNIRQFIGYKGYLHFVKYEVFMLSSDGNWIPQSQNTADKST